MPVWLDHITPKTPGVVQANATSPRFLHTETAQTSTVALKGHSVKGLPGGHSEWEPPDPIPNSEVKLLSADDSVGFPHVKVGHCQAFYSNPTATAVGFFTAVYPV